ncbi:DNase I-like protein [Dentipellis sp. KUC8613]|nr:DNase I-like protein [Dentipellis sp. KUC8613]
MGLLAFSLVLALACRWSLRSPHCGIAKAVSIADIQGPAFQSPFAGQTLHNITGVVSAKGDDGFWLLGPQSSDVRKSPGVRVFSTSTSVLSLISVDSNVSLSGRVAEFRSSSDDLFGTEIDSPTSIVMLSNESSTSAKPVILGKDRFPPTQSFTDLDKGSDGWLSVPNNVTQVEKVNATLQPTQFGLDFWKSLEGALVVVPAPTALDFPNSFGEFWIRGNWTATGINGRGGLSVTIGPDNVPDANPEVVIVGSPLDGTTNPDIAVGSKLSDITGVILFQFGFYYILPTTAPTIVSQPNFDVPPTTLTSEDNECVLTLGDYNIDNMAPTSPTLPLVASHIATHLLTPDIVFLQEIQDNSGPTDDGTVNANVTLATLSVAIANASASGDAQSKAVSTEYSFLDIDPVDGMDGGEPGGNIRQAYLYRANKISLVSGEPGGSLDATQPFLSASGQVQLTLNPGRIDPNNTAWLDSRKPLVAHWQTFSGHQFFTINHHGTAKSGSSSTEGDARPPVNLGVDQRTAQVQAIANFTKSILDLDPNASILIAGDFNEYVQTRSVFAPFSVAQLSEADVLANIPPVERYTYVFDQNCEQLDHIFVSQAVAKRAGGVQVEHVHVNNWAPTLDARGSDHDPSVAKVRVC